MTGGGLRLVRVAADGGWTDGDGVPVGDRLEIGRWAAGREGTPGLLLVRDPTVSSRHCVLVRRADGRVVVRDTSRNGTRLDGRRLVPNVEVALRPGQVLSLGDGHEFVVRGRLAAGHPEDGGTEATPGGTVVESKSTDVTVLVGDIRDYTVLVRRGPAADVQSSVSRVFAALEREIAERGGTVKEFQGDAIVAFWEDRRPGDRALAACRTALALDRLGRRLADDPGVWSVPGFPLRLDWALASGFVVIRAHGEDSPLGLSMIGEAVPLAFRLEKLADESTGPILACGETRALAGGAFRFRDLGTRDAKGFDGPVSVWGLEGETKEDDA